jgi:hypothetical protein
VNGQALALGGAAAVLWSLEQRTAVPIKPWMRPGYAQAMSVLAGARIGGQTFSADRGAIAWLQAVKNARVAQLGSIEDQGGGTYPRQSFSELKALLDAAVAAWRAARRVSDQPWGLVRDGEEGRPDEATGDHDGSIEAAIRAAGGIEYNWLRPTLLIGGSVELSSIGEDRVPVLAWQVELAQKYTAATAGDEATYYIGSVWHRIASALSGFDTYGNDPSGEFEEQPSVIGGLGAGVGAIGDTFVRKPLAWVYDNTVAALGGAVLDSWIPWAALLYVAWRVSK